MPSAQRASIAPEELRTQIDLGSAPVIFDVRSPEEYVEGHVPGAVNVPFWRLVAAAPPVESPDAPLVVYCGHGPRARIAMLALRMRGYANLCELDGHWAEWRRLTFAESKGERP